MLADFGRKRTALGREQREQKRAHHVREEDHCPESQRVEDLLALVEHYDDGEERVLSEELRASNDDSDESDGIAQIGNQLLRFARGKRAAQHSSAQSGEPHGDAASESGEHQRNGAALKFFLGG